MNIARGRCLPNTATARARLSAFTLHPDRVKSPCQVQTFGDVVEQIGHPPSDSAW